MIKTIQFKNKAVRIIDQTKLPQKLVYKDCRLLRTLWLAIRRLEVRGAPALGAAAAFGVLMGTQDFKGEDRELFISSLNKVCDYLATSRPTAVNLFHSLEAMRMVPWLYPSASVTKLKDVIRKKAFEIYETDRAVCRAMGDHGARLIRNGDRLMTICNAGALATVDYGTALGVFYSAQKADKRFEVFACETRPLLQGARLTAWELTHARIATTLITDNMASVVMRDKGIRAVFTGADRIAANGDAANKIGTYGLAVLAKHHRIPFYVVAPRTTFDLAILKGNDIPIEERDPQEVRQLAGRPIAPKTVSVFNPAFDVTPHDLITAFVTERGIIKKPFNKTIKKIFS
ncbi:MAG TPA: S-methyl-5-thioribose-1-phosphate isomerase [Candidatus Omnitrophota bacterium]|nr:S-methyl-5-thioribose-1-phosphate isomerase [Candidatus Omnitrophota bacterium]HSA31206.1 S-methyl-5-thioribose-1-phosphate isomerase [Candidatus Omnitrophota bacterium]